MLIGIDAAVSYCTLVWTLPADPAVPCNEGMKECPVPFPRIADVRALKRSCTTLAMLICAVGLLVYEYRGFWRCSSVFSRSCLWCGWEVECEQDYCHLLFLPTENHHSTACGFFAFLDAVAFIHGLRFGYSDNALLMLLCVTAWKGWVPEGLIPFTYLIFSYEICV